MWMTELFWKNDKYTLMYSLHDINNAQNYIELTFEIQNQ